MEENTNFFKKVWTSIRDFEKYEEFAAEKLWTAVKYILILTLIFTAIISLFYTCKFNLVLEDAKKYIYDNIDEIKIENGKLTASSEKGIVIENEENIIPIIIIDTSEGASKEKYIDKVNLYDTGLIVLSDRVVVISKLLSGEENIYYSDMFTSNIANKEEFMRLISGTNMMYACILFCATIFIYMFVIYFTSNIIDAIVLGVLGYLFAKLVKLRLRFKATFNIGVYALTLPIMLNLMYIGVNTFTGFRINYFQWMYEAISYIYVAVAILMIKTEIINQKIQLIKIEKIQKNVAEEQSEDKSEEKEDKEKEEEEKDEQKQVGEEPEGSNA